MVLMDDEEDARKVDVARRDASDDLDSVLVTLTLRVRTDEDEYELDGVFERVFWLE